MPLAGLAAGGQSASCFLTGIGGKTWTVCLCSSAPGLATTALLAVCFICWLRSGAGRVVFPASERLVALVLREQTLCKLPPSPVTHLSALSQASLLHTTGNPPQPPVPGGGSPLCRSPSAAPAGSSRHLFLTNLRDSFLTPAPSFRCH